MGLRMIKHRFQFAIFVSGFNIISDWVAYHDGSYQCKPFTVVRVKALVKAVRLSKNPSQHGPEITTHIH